MCMGAPSMPKMPEMPEAPPPAPMPPPPAPAPEPEKPLPPPTMTTSEKDVPRVKQPTTARKELQKKNSGANALRIPLNTGAPAAGSGGSLNIPK